MPTFSKHDIDTLAFRAVDDFKQGSGLHDSIVKLAKENSMNPEQIKRLVESANTAAFLSEFKSKAGNQRMVEFDVADPAKVIDESLSSGGSSSSPTISITVTLDRAAQLHDDVADENMPVVEHSEPEQKVASYNDMESSAPKPLVLNSFEAYRIRDSLLTKIAHCNYEASDLADELSRQFKGIYQREKHAGFELDALSSYGNKAIAPLQMIRNRLGMPKIARQLSAGEEFILADRHVVEDTVALEKIASIMSLIEEHTKLKRGLEKVGEYHV